MDTNENGRPETENENRIVIYELHELERITRK